MAVRPSTVPEFILWLGKEIARDDADDSDHQENWEEARAWLSDRYLPGEVERLLGNTSPEGEYLNGLKRLQKSLTTPPKPAKPNGASEQKNGPYHGNTFVWDGKACSKLTPQDYRILEFFWDHGRLLAIATWDDLAERVWGKRAEEVEWSAVKSAVYRLNNKLQEEGIYLDLTASDATYAVRVAKFQRFFVK
jgi:hypothetical protein